MTAIFLSTSSDSGQGRLISWLVRLVVELVASQGTSVGVCEPAAAAKGGGQLQRPWAATMETAALINWKVHSSTQHPINHQINLAADSRGESEFYQ